MIQEQEHAESTDLLQGESGQQSGCGLRTRRPIYLQNLVRTSLSNDTSGINFSWSSDHFFQKYEPNCGKMPHLAMLKNLSKNPRSGSRLRNLPKFNQFFLFRGYGKIFMIRSVPVVFYLRFLTDRQTNKQINRQTPGKTLPHWRRWQKRNAVSTSAYVMS